MHTQPASGRVHCTLLWKSISPACRREASLFVTWTWTGMCDWPFWVLDHEAPNPSQTMASLSLRRPLKMSESCLWLGEGHWVELALYFQEWGLQVLVSVMVSSYLQPLGLLGSLKVWKSAWWPARSAPGRRTAPTSCCICFHWLDERKVLIPFVGGDSKIFHDVPPP